MIIVGVTGPNAAGKSEVARYLIGKGFHYVSLADIVREELQQQSLPLDRALMTQTGAQLRRAFGAGILAERIRSRLRNRTVVDSIRHPGEVDALRAAGDFFLIAVTAPSDVRLARIRQRSRPGDTQHLETFLAEETAQNSDDPMGQRIADCVALADVTVSNIGTVAQLHHAVEDAVTRRFGTI